MRSSGHMFASRAINHGCLVVLTCYTTASIKASFLGVQPSECQKYTANTRIPPRTCTHDWAIDPSFDMTVLSSLPMTAPKLLSTATKTRPANLQLCLASKLNCSSIASFLILCSTPRKISEVPLYLLKNFFSIHHAEPLSKVHLTIFKSFYLSLLLFHSFVGTLFCHSSAPNCLPSFYFYLASLPSVLCCFGHFPTPHQLPPDFGRPATRRRVICPFSPYSIQFFSSSPSSSPSSFSCLSFSFIHKNLFVKSLHLFNNSIFLYPRCFVFMVL